MGRRGEGSAAAAAAPVAAAVAGGLAVAGRTAVAAAGRVGEGSSGLGGWRRGEEGSFRRGEGRSIVAGVVGAGSGLGELDLELLVVGGGLEGVQREHGG